MKLCGFEVGLDKPLFLIAGPCIVESEQLQIDTAGTRPPGCLGTVLVAGIACGLPESSAARPKRSAWSEGRNGAS